MVDTAGWLTANIVAGEVDMACRWVRIADWGDIAVGDTAGCPPVSKGT